LFALWIKNLQHQGKKEDTSLLEETVMIVDELKTEDLGDISDDNPDDVSEISDLIVSFPGGK
jgi:hypothetical protein